MLETRCLIMIRALQGSGTRRSAITALLAGLGLPLLPGLDADARRKGKARRRRTNTRRANRKTSTTTGQGKGQEKVTLCHKPGTPAEQTLVIAAPAVKAHLAHGDVLGACGTACDPNTCTAPDNPCREAYCTDEGACGERDRADGAPCSTGDLCTINDTCIGGVCQPGPRRFCPDFDQCREGRCNSGTGQCEPRNKIPGTPCDDRNPCTERDACNANGVCEGLPKFCPPGRVCCSTGEFIGQCKGGEGDACSLFTGSDCCSGVCAGVTCFGG